MKFKDENGDIIASSIIKLVFSIIIFIILLIIVFNFGGKMYDRYQAKLDAQNQVIVNQKIIEIQVQNANNEVLVNEIKIKQQEQLIKVEQQKAEIRVVEARGIAKAQEIINKTLTDKYLQHEAIGAQEKMARSPNHTTIYIPSGQNGIPLVKTIE